ncbi:hypothetical protein TRFO_12546 [Tritrichomonas foetus]|uniref:Uncharacterized protein n=1 Tax=Tritrichomonas foetus TaxID=1144522 RepID=A0A1J4L5F7_9EUKA|nr:hypothetical protein TRFO_12546 [Tritrichomonas foetus]|eukprot:OHT17220.1 hypothetical protein TRFO_12546 [Tritrichomonas foetus]
MLDYIDTPEVNKKQKKIPNEPFYFLLASLIVSGILFLFDRGPPVPPFPKITDSIDCHSISYLNHSVHDGVIDFYCHEDETVQYPEEFLPHFISLRTATQKVMLQFSKSHLQNMSRINDTIKFSLIQPVSGPVEVSLRCLEHEFSKQKIVLNEINETDNNLYSTLKYLDNDVNSTRLTNVCFENSKFLFFAQMPGYAEVIPFNQSTMKFEVLGWILPAYLHYKQVNRTNETAILLPPFESTSWKSILFHLLPISESIQQSNEIESKKLNFLFRETPLKGSNDIIKRFSSTAPSKIKDIQCFKKILIPSSSSYHPSDHNSIEKALESDFTHLRKAFVKYQTQNRKILLASSLAKLESPIKDICHNCSVVILQPKTEVTKCADHAGSSQILIGNHISNLLNLIWMTPNQTAVIDASSSHYICNNWVKELARKSDVKYYRANDDRKEKCKCDNFKCYPKGPGDDPEVDIEMFKEVFKAALNETKLIEQPPQQQEQTKEIILNERFFQL